VAEDNEDIGDLVEEEPKAIVLEENNAVDVDETEVTVWAPEPKGSDEILKSSVEEWIKDVDFESTEDVPIPKRLVDQVIGQEAGSLIIKKAAEQRRHMLMIGDPGTGKSMLARSMTDLLPADSLEDILVYPNEEDENEPRVRSVPAGRGDRIIKVQKEAIRQQKAKSQKVLLLAFGLIGLLLFIAALQSGDIMTLLFGGFLLAFGYMFIRSRLGSVDESRIPKLLIKHEQGEAPPFIDATATLAGSLLGDVRHDPFQSGGMETSAHDRVEPGAIHRANKGVLYIDEVNLLRLEEQQALLTAMQERAFSISGRSERSSGALTKTEPVPCDFILIAAGNLDAIQGMHPALRSRIRGYGYEVYVNSEMPDTARNRRRLIRFIAQEVLRDIDTTREIPHFDKSGVSIILREAQRRAGRRGKLSLRLRELGGLVRIAGDLAMEENAPLTTAEHVLKAREIAKPLEQQVADRIIERRLDYSQIVSTGERVGRVNGLAVLGANSGLSDFSGIMLPVEALVTPSHGGGGKIHATGGLSDLAKESVTNVSAVIKKLTGKDVSDYDIHVQFVNTHGVDGDSASITIATAVISALENIPIRQDLAMTGSLSVRGEVLPIGGVTAKIEAAARCGIKTVVIPRANMQDVMLDDKYEDMIDVIAVDTLDEVMLHALVKHSDKAGLVERLEAVIDRLTPANVSISPA
jgi:Lon-like ATP-dependent protease